MMKKNNDYIVGLSLEPDAVGFAAIDKKNKLISLKGKNVIGVTTFQEGQTAEERRTSRSARRLNHRKKRRIKFLEEIFAEEMAKVDPGFFVRQHNSWVSPLDKERTANPAIIFPTKSEEKEFYKAYPTVYHLRQALMTENKKFDLREIYIAMHSIIKRRGNFLYSVSAQSFDTSKINVRGALETINDNYQAFKSQGLTCCELAVENAEKIEDVIKGVDEDKTIFTREKIKKTAKLLATDKPDKAAQKMYKQLATAIFGFKAQFDVILGESIDKAEKPNWSLKLSDEDYEDKLEAISGSLNDEQQAIVKEIQSLYTSIVLNSIVPDGQTISESMIQTYNQHKKDLILLRKATADQEDPKKAEKLKLAYDLYINNRSHGKVLAAKKAFNKNKKLTTEEFYKQVKSNLPENSDNSAEILTLIENNEFLPVLRSRKNTSIPYQLQQKELDLIIKNQSKYYPFLAEENPVKEHRKQAPYKLDELIRFKIPYYVGPLITEADQKSTTGKDFAWLVRSTPNDHAQITPWNFNEKVDIAATANKFIRKMTVKDTYILGEDVLPAKSLIYQRFEVLNELNGLKVNDKKLSVETKQDIYKDLFQSKITVNESDLVDYLHQQKGYSKVEIAGLTPVGKTFRFNSSLSSYIHFRKLGLFDKQLDDAKYQKDFEKIIEWASIFNDKKIYQQKLREITWLSEKQFKSIANWTLNGWGRLSKRLLTELYDENGQNIIERLWDSKQNFQQIITSAGFKKEIDIANEDMAKSTDLEDILAEAYTTPSNKKTVRKASKIVKEIVSCAGHNAPSQIVLSKPIINQNPYDLSRNRGKELLKKYEQATSSLINKELVKELEDCNANRLLSSDKYYLYFSQAGRDALTGEKIPYSEVKSCVVRNVLPKKFSQSRDISNKILVIKSDNNAKIELTKECSSRIIPDIDITVGHMWSEWQADELINKAKLDNLYVDPDNLQDFEQNKYLGKELSVKSAIVKLLAVVLHKLYPKTEIILINSQYPKALRERLDLYRNTQVNDYYNGMDAYLNAVCGNFLYQVYPKFRSYMVYGQYDIFNGKGSLKNLKQFNLVWPLLQKNDAKQKNAGKIYESGTDKVLFDRQNDFYAPLIRAYNFKIMLFSQETYTEDEAMTKATIYPRADRDKAGTRTSLVPKKKGLDPEIYGGFSNSKNSFMVIVKIKTAKEDTYKAIPIAMRYRDTLEKAKKNKTYDETLRSIVEPVVATTRGYRGFDIIVNHLNFNQEMVNQTYGNFILSKATYMYNGNQIVLSPDAMRILTGKLEEKEDEDSSLVKVYDEILEQVDKYLPLFNMRSYNQKLHDARKVFEKLDVRKKRSTLSSILRGLHCNSSSSDIKELGIGTGFGFFQKQSGIPLTSDTLIVFKSITGLRRRKVSLSDLEQ